MSVADALLAAMDLVGDHRPLWWACIAIIGGSWVFFVWMFLKG